MIVDRLVRRVHNASESIHLTLDDPTGWGIKHSSVSTSPEHALKLSAVFRAVDGISNSIAKLPLYIMDETTKERKPEHPLTPLLTLRPNELMTAQTYKKMLETERLLTGNGYAWIHRDPLTCEPVELVPLQAQFVTPWLDTSGNLWYMVRLPNTGKQYKLSPADMLHFKGFSRDGITGLSVLRYAAEVIATGRQTQQYEMQYYAKGTHVPGVLSTDADLSSEQREAVRAEWERIHSGADNAFRIAVLDIGTKYQPIGISNKDSQFIESKGVTVEDISRFFAMPLYKLGAGKQSYSSNEQNAIEYVNDTLMPSVIQYEQEYSYKLLFRSDLRQNLRVRVNQNAELRGDLNARANWYKSMREVGAYSVNDVLALEDLPSVSGGETRLASLNYIPLELFYELAIARNKGGETK